MRTNDFMDKPMMMGLSRSRSDDDFSGGDFSHNSSSLPNSINLMGHFDLASASHQRAGASDASLISVIDRKLKEHVDNVLYAVEGISARLSQLETRTRRLESTIDDLKESVEHNQGRADGKLRELENILREVQGGVLDLRDKQEIAEAQVQLAKLQSLKNDKGSENQNNSVQMNSTPETSSFSQQQTQKPYLSPVACPQQLSVPPNNASPNLSYQSPQPLPAETAQLPSQMAQNQFYSVHQPEPHYPPPSQASEIMHQQYHMHSTQHLPPQPQPSAQHLPPQPSAQQSSPQPSAQPFPPQPLAQHVPPQSSVQQQPYGSAPQPPQTSQLQQPPQLHQPMSGFGQGYHPVSNHPEENSYMPPPNYPPSAYNPSQLPRASQAQRPYVNSAQQMHNQPSSGSSEFPYAYFQAPEYSNSGNMYHYYGSPTYFRGSTMKSSQLTKSPSASPGVNNHSSLPTAKLLPQALPTAHILPEALPSASSVDDGSSSGGTRSKVPVDDVVESVVAMGFRRDLVRATVRKMTEDGQSVNLNAVLDKVMND